MNSGQNKKVSPITSSITTKSDSLSQQIAKDSQETIHRWVQHFKKDTGFRIPLSEINIQKGLLEPAIRNMLPTIEDFRIIAILSKQIEDMMNFLNVRRNFNSEQILDTAELIIREFSDLSLTAIMDCIYKIKAAAPPFNFPLYETFDGRKLMECLHAYRNLQIEENEKTHQKIKNNSELFESETFRNIVSNAIGAKEAEAFKPDFNRDLSHWDRSILDWTDEFYKQKREKGETPYIGEVDEYLKMKIEQHNQQK